MTTCSTLVVCPKANGLAIVIFIDAVFIFSEISFETGSREQAMRSRSGLKYLVLAEIDEKTTAAIGIKRIAVMAIIRAFSALWIGGVS